MRTLKLTPVKLHVNYLAPFIEKFDVWEVFETKIDTSTYAVIANQWVLKMLHFKVS